MENKIQKVGKIDHVNLFYDPLRKGDTFIIMRKGGEAKSGFVLIPNEYLENGDPAPVKAEDVQAVLESGERKKKWEDVSGIIAGFNDQEMFQRIKEAYEKNE